METRVMTQMMKTQPPPTDAPMMISKGRPSARETGNVTELNSENLLLHLLMKFDFNFQIIKFRFNFQIIKMNVGSPAD